LLNARALILARIFAARFQIANACLSGVKRLAWVWIMRSSLILWLQGCVLIGG
jgi:hypothetical protein